jgi:hypothetical protein
MRILGNSLIVCVLLLTAACGSLAPGSTRYQTEANANQYVGDNIQTVVQAWGTPDQAMHTREGSSYYVYLTKTQMLENQMQSSYDPELVGRRGQAFGISNSARGSNNGLRCTTTFKTDNTGKILWAKHQGSSCAGTWVNTAEK